MFRHEPIKGSFNMFITVCNQSYISVVTYEIMSQIKPPKKLVYAHAVQTCPRQMMSPGQRGTHPNRETKREAFKCFREKTVSTTQLQVFGVTSLILVLNQES